MTLIYHKTNLLFGKDYGPAIIEEIDQAKQYICIFMFEWRYYKNDPSSDSSLITLAIIRAVKRGVKVRAIVHYPSIVSLLNAQGIQTKKWQHNKLMHAKSVLIDNTCAFVGSHNFTLSALGPNLEISARITDKDFLFDLLTLFNKLW